MLNLDSVVPDEPIRVPNGADQDVKWNSDYESQFKGMIPARMALAESRNAVAIWIAGEIGIASVLRTARSLGFRRRCSHMRRRLWERLKVPLMELVNGLPYDGIRYARPAICTPVRGVVRLLHWHGSRTRPYRFPDGCDGQDGNDK